jgi:hypothetical protein
VKIIFSRKGFDSASGGSASPIFPDGKMVSIPIPEQDAQRKYSDLRSPVEGYDNLGEIVEPLTGMRVRASHGVHLDPDIDPDIVTREPGWRGLFGQVDVAQSHLANAGVSVGDLFIMFGWFRDVEQRNGRIRWKRGAPDLHVIFGWLQVGQVLHIGTHPVGLPKWATNHPHAVQGVYHQNNTLYVASESLNLAGFELTGMNGSGIFRGYSKKRRLTAPGAPGRRKWRLPTWFDPSRTLSPLTYHSRPDRWHVVKDFYVDLDTVGRGQEFVFDTAVYPEAINWFADVFDHRPS